MEDPYLMFARLLPEGMRRLAHLDASGWIVPAAQWILKKYT